MISNFVYSQNDTILIEKTFTYPSGKQSSKGLFKNKKPIGYWTNFYESGQISSYGKWNENGLDSTWLFYAKNGNLERSVSYGNNLKNGSYLVYDSLNLIAFDGFYVNDTLQGPFKRFKDGKLLEDGNYSSGEIDGLLRKFDPSTGQILSMNTFTNGKIVSENAVNQILDGKKQGLWETFDENGKLISQERFKNGEIVRDDSDPSITFDFEEEFHSNGQLKTQYALVKGKKNGVQSHFSDSGERLASQIYKNDTLFSTGWFSETGLKDSLWQNYYPNGDLYAKGKYKDGEKTGMWYYYFHGKIVEQKGRYKNDLPTGEWTWYYRNGQIRRLETFFKGKYEGQVLDYDSTGSLIQEQTYSYNSREGEYYYFIGDQQEKGKFQNGLRDGKWIYRFDNGKKSFVGKYKDGQADGKHKFWFENGRQSQLIHYKKGKKEGYRYEFAKNGKLIHTYLYKNDKLVSLDGTYLGKE